MIQWIFLVFSLFGMANQYRQTYLANNQTYLTNQNQPIKYLYLHPNGYYYDFPPQVREYSNQSQEALANPYWTQGTQGYYYGQPPQAYAYPQGY